MVGVMSFLPRDEFPALFPTLNSRRYFADGIRSSAQRRDPQPLGGLVLYGVATPNGKNAELGIFSEMPSSTKCGVN
jgi:hypothetical protein